LNIFFDAYFFVESIHFSDYFTFYKNNYFLVQEIQLVKGGIFSILTFRNDIIW